MKSEMSKVSDDPLKTIDSALVRSHTAKILASAGFSGSDRMSRFLRFAVETALAGRGAELKEYLLGIEVFDRRENFDPRIDPIVRVEARRLRSKLKAYYKEDGSRDSIVIELPTGSYLPRFRQANFTPAVPAATGGDIVVLPFANLSPDPDTEYFSDGLTEELIHALTKMKGLRVVAWSTAEKLKDRQDDIPSIGRQLNVDAVLAGNVRNSGGRLRIMARLIDTASGLYLWSEVYDRQLEDVFAIQEEISRAIADTLQIRFGGAIARSPAKLESYNLYLKGRFHWNKRTRSGLDRAIAYFREAVAVEPDFAAGYAGLADAYTMVAGQGLESPSHVIAEAKSTALRALELDPDLGEAHASLARIISLHEWKWAEAEVHYRRAIELNPGYISAHHWFACNHLALLGRFSEAVAEAEIAFGLDPLSCLVQESIGYVLMLAGRVDEALEHHHKAADLDPYFYRAYTGLGRTYMRMGRYGEAIEMIERGRALSDDSPLPLGALGQAHALAGNRAEARALLRQLAKMGKSRHVPATAFAMIHAGLGENRKALDWLEKGCDRQESSIGALKVHPAYESLRGEARFGELLRRMGLG